ITLGGNTESIALTTAKGMAEVSRAVKELTETTSREIAEKISNATALITGGLGGYVYIGHSADGHPDEILIMDAPRKENAVNVIRLNKNGIGFSRNGYNGTYRNAWTIDGNLVADFITTGTMSADRVRGGTLEAGGYGLGRNGKIKVLDSQGNEIGTWDRYGLYVAAGTIKGSKLIVDGRLAPINYEEQYENTLGSGYETQPEIEPDPNDPIEPGEVVPAIAEEIVPAEATELPDWIRDEKSEMTGSIEVYDKFGNVIGRWDADGLHVTKGVIDGPDIKGSNIFGAGIVIGGQDYGNGYILVQTERGHTFFKANKSILRLGGFKVYVSDVSGATYLALEDETVGMGDGQSFAFWAGSDGDDPPFHVDQSGGVWCSDMGPDWRGYTVGRAIKWIWDNWPGG
ncbi:MAG: hypothetical protein KBS39_00530, partial [Lachnospiraceae bacterium]|nr:hypothetical protein [Candidatus Hippenecus merdae]